MTDYATARAGSPLNSDILCRKSSLPHSVYCKSSKSMRGNAVP